MQVQTASASASNAQSNATPRAAPTSDYQTFLNMLTAQMKNQDPLNPMNASDFAVQLATFSGVEQQTQTNQLLTALMGQSGLSDLGSWVGMEARIYGGAWYDGAAITLAPDPDLGADQAILTVRDANGVIVDSRELSTSAQNYEWDGRSRDGTQLPDGKYTFELESRRGEDTLSRRPVAAYVMISEARYENGGTKLVLPGGLLVDSGSVSGLRRPQA